VNTFSSGMVELIDFKFAGCTTVRLHDGQTCGTQVHNPVQFTWCGPVAGRVHPSWMWWQALAREVASVLRLEEP
jgi:hypothetical protein